MRDLRAHLDEAISTLQDPEAAEFRELLGQAPPGRLDYTIELGLRVLERVEALAGPELALRPIDGWTLFGGYPFARAAGRLPEDGAGECERLLRTARHHLEPMHRREIWSSGLLSYLRLPERIRGYDLSLKESAKWRFPSLAGNRRDVYDTLLFSPPPFRKNPLKLAGPGQHRFRGPRIGTENVTLPDDIPRIEVTGFDLEAAPSRTSFSEPVEFLENTARRMAELDVREKADGRRGHDDWESRFQRMDLFTLNDSDDRFEQAEDLVVDGLLHLIGVPGVGKSTLRDIVTAHAVVELGWHVTLVVGDVSECLRVVERFNRMGRAARKRAVDGDTRYERWSRLHATPIIGSSTREQHTARLHHRVSQIYDTPLAHHDEAFGHLSTACPLSALRGAEAAEPLRFSEAPCQTLIPLKEPDSDSAPEEPEELTVRRGCPLWGSCPRHETARELREATIWVATPESLAVSSLPRHQNADRIRYLELACHNSNMIIIDEADQVQIRLDRVFSPTATLYKPGDDSWLDELDRHKVAELAREGRVQLTDSQVDQWTAALDTVSTTANRIYAMLVNNDELRSWAQEDFFSVWSLQLELVSRWPTTRFSDDVLRAEKVGTRRARTAQLLAYLEPDCHAHQEIRDKRRSEILEILDDFRDDPVGDTDEELLVNPEPAPKTLRLAELARRLITNSPGNPRVARELEQTLLSLTGLRDPREFPDDEWEDSTVRENVLAEFDRERHRFEFTLLLAVLHDRLNLLTTLWPRVETALRLDASTNALYHSSPADYAPHIPESPMGNILAFQFVADQREHSTPTGELRFFRCTGVGRELLRVLPSLGTVGGERGPNVILMSGTSWAGASTRYHVAEQVRAVLSARTERTRTPTAEDGPRSAASTTDRSSGPKVTMHPAFVYGRPPSSPPDGPEQPLQLSGAPLDDRPEILRQMVRGLTRPDPADVGRPSKFRQEIAQLKIPRRHLLVLVGSYIDARLVAEEIHESKDWRGKVCVLVSDDAEIPPDHGLSDLDDSASVPVLRRGDLASFRDTGRAILVAPMLSVERGHNILNWDEKAIFGSVYFLSRPFPQPGDIGVLVHALNDLTVRRTLPGGGFDDMVREHGSLDEAGLAWRLEARRELRRLANRRLSWRGLSADDREYLTWDLLVVLWQVIGRLTRGGVDARVHFVDAAFAPKLAAGIRGDTASTSLLASMRDVLAPYFGETAPASGRDVPQHRLPVSPSTRYLAEALYRPLYTALVDLLRQPPPLPHLDANAQRES
ncbi:signal recognition particle [Nocardiopsis mangrovi]|uniref:Signal recognition particle n=1 Tax=Nocardiopsis mangrovi TaxID=1179818 RepID=A0ABV9DZI8_9ACTN